ncbi:M23 family metallopeptidase [Candidatus Woesebacteria bacterium]|nr:MAG: M23 family metallopeptidase [Candidatus Woesebacteria bacterium]
MAKDQENQRPSTTGQIAGSAAKTVTKKVVTKAATKATVRAAGQALGSLAPGVGNAIAAVAAEIAGELIARMVNAMQKFSKDARDLLGGLALASAHAFSITLSILAAVGVALASPIIIVFVIIPIAVSIILFIINSGAWVVPPWSGQSDPFLVDSAFIEVSKTASITNIPNENLPWTVQYTVSIIAERSVLTDINIEYRCYVSKRQGTPPSCPPINPGLPTPPQEISPGTPFVFTYSQAFPDSTSYYDTAVTDIITITATAEGLTGESSQASATVRIGNAPDECLGPAANPNTRPSATGVIASGNYYFPMAEYGRLGYDCYHHDGNLAVDIGVQGNPGDAHLPLLAYTSGRIYLTLQTAAGGNGVFLAGDDGRNYYYAHTCDIYSKVGDFVQAGEVIATSDNTGNSTAEHLHFAINNGSLNFPGGDGTICPQTDFEQKFGLGVCPNYSTNCVIP